MGKGRKPTTEELLHGGYKPPYGSLDLLKDILFGVLVVALAFGWMILMLLIISFVTLSYLHFRIKWMLAVSGIFGAAAGTWYICRTVKKNKKEYKKWTRS